MSLSAFQADSERPGTNWGFTIRNEDLGSVQPRRLQSPYCGQSICDSAETELDWARGCADNQNLQPAVPQLKKSKMTMTPTKNNDRLFTTLMYAAMFLIVVGLGIASRLWLVDMPNFKPIAALVLFGGFFFRKAWIAIAAVVIVMAVTDLQLGVYQWQIALSVYASLALACVLGMWVRKSLQSQQSQRLLPTVGVQQAGRFVISSLAMSTVFFLLTNGAVWCAGWYPQTGEGLLACYWAGLPFYRATMLGDLFFTCVTVAGYCSLAMLVSRLDGATQNRKAFS